MKNAGKQKVADLSKNMLLFTISSFGSKIISFLLVPLYTAVLTTSEFGTVDLITATATLLIPIFTIDVQDAVMRFALDSKYKNDDVISTGVRIMGIGSAALSVIVILLKCIGVLRLSVPLLLFLVLSFVLGSLNNTFTLYLKGTDRISVLVISGLLNTILTCVLNIYLLLFLKQGLNGYLIANVVGIGVAIVYQLIFGRLIQDIHLFKFKSHFKPMSEYSVPLIINSVAWWINSASDRYILTFIRGVSANGLYSVSYKIPTILSTVQTVFYNAWSIAAVTEFDADDHDGFIGKTYTMYSVVSILACSLIMLLNIPLAKMLYSKDFFLAWKYVPFILVGTVFNGIAVFQGCLFAAVKKTKAVSRSTTVGAVVNIGCTVIFVYYFGAMGAAFATLVGYLVTWIFRSIQLNEIIHMKVDWTRHYLSCLILVVQSFVAIRRGTFFVQLIMILVLAFISGKYMVSILQKVLNAFIERIRKN